MGPWVTVPHKDPAPPVPGKRAACGLGKGRGAGDGSFLSASRPGPCVSRAPCSWAPGGSGRVRAAAGLAPRALSGPGTRASGRDEPAGQPGSSRVRVPSWAPGSEESPGDAGSPRAPARPGGGRARPRGQIAADTSEPRASSAAGLRGPGLFFRSTFSFYFIRESLMFQFFKDRSVPSEKSHLVVCGAKRGAGPSRERRAAGSAQAGAVGSPSPARPRARPPAGGPPTSRTW